MQLAVRRSLEQGKLSLEINLWFCCFAQYQNEDNAGPSIGDQLSLSPFENVINVVKSSHGVLSLHTTRDDVYSRLWCVHELNYAMKQRVKITTAFSEDYENEVCRRLRCFKTRCLQTPGPCKHCVFSGCDCKRGVRKRRVCEHDFLCLRTPQCLRTL